MKTRAGIITILCFVMMFALTGCVKVVQIGHEAEVTGAKSFNAAENVEAIWESQALPELKQNAVDLPQFLTESNGKLSSLASKYGHYSMGDKGELSYIVKGQGKITEVNNEKKAGYMTLQLEVYSAPEQVKLQIGSVYKGSAVRVCLSFIKYEDYTNQVDWAQVSQSIHDVIDKDVVKKADVANLKGKTVEFTGCFSVGSNQKEILVTPVEMTVK